MKKYLFSLLAMGICGSAHAQNQMEDFSRVASVNSSAYSHTAIDAQGRVYTASDQGLLRSDDNGMSWVSVANGLDISNVQGLSAESNRITVLSNNTLMTADTTDLMWTTVPGPNNETMTELRQSADGSIYVMTQSGRVYSWDDENETFNDLSTMLSSSTVTDFELGPDGELMIAGDGGIDISMDNGQNFNNVMVDLGETSFRSINNITAIEYIDDNNLMLASNNGILRQLNLMDSTITEITTNLQGSITDLKYLGGNAWLAMNSSGLYLSTDAETFTQIVSGNPNTLDYTINAQGSLVTASEGNIQIRPLTNLEAPDNYRMQFNSNNVIGMGFGDNGEISAVTASEFYSSTQSPGRFDYRGSGLANVNTINEVYPTMQGTVISTDNGVYTSFSGDTLSSMHTMFDGKNVVGMRLLFNGQTFIGTEDGLYTTTNGMTYTEVDFTETLDLDTEVTAIDMDANGNLLVANNSNIYTSMDDGETFEATGGSGLDALLSGSTFTNATFNQNGEIIAITSDGRSLASANGWAEFGELNNDIGIQNVQELKMDNQGNIYIFGDSKVMISMDGGANFMDITQNIDGGNINNIAVNETTGTIYVLTDSGVRMSADGGASFTDASLDINTGNVMSALNTETGVMLAATEKGVIRSDNNGQFFGPPEMLAGGETITRLVQTENGNILAATESGLMVSTDDGMSFSQGALTDDISRFEVMTNGSVLARTDNGIMYSTDNGETWTSLSLEEGFAQDINMNSQNLIVSANSEGNLYTGPDAESMEEFMIRGEAGPITLDEVAKLEGDMIIGLSSDNRLVYSDDNGTTFMEYSLMNDIGNISEIKLGRNGNAMMLGQNGIMEFNGSTMAETVLSGTLNSNNLQDIELGAKGQVVATTASSLMMSESSSMAMNDVNPDLTMVDFGDIEFNLGGEGDLVVSTEGGLMLSDDYGEMISSIEAEGLMANDAAYTGNDAIISISNGMILKTDAAGDTEMIDLGVEIMDDAQLDSRPNGYLYLLNDGQLWTSIDKGNSWVAVDLMGETLTNLEVLNNGTVFGTTSNGVTYMWDDSMEMHVMNTAGMNLDWESIDYAMDAEENIYISSETTGIWRSEDGGQTFTDFNIGITSTMVNNITSSEQGFVYAVTSDGIYYLDINEDEFVMSDVEFEGDWSAVADIEAMANEGNRPGAINLRPEAGDYFETVVISSPMGVYASDVALTVEEDGTGDSVEEIGAVEIAAYPSPAPRIQGIELTMERAEEATLTMTNSTGNTVYALSGVQLATGYNNIPLADMPDLAQGSYYINVMTSTGMTTIPVVIVK